MLFILYENQHLARGKFVGLSRESICGFLSWSGCADKETCTDWNGDHHKTPGRLASKEAPTVVCVVFWYINAHLRSKVTRPRAGLGETLSEASTDPAH